MRCLIKTRTGGAATVTGTDDAGEPDDLRHGRPVAGDGRVRKRSVVAGIEGIQSYGSVNLRYRDAGETDT